MTKPNTYWLFNNTANDGENTGNATGGAGGSSSNWVVIDLTNDALAWCSEQQTDGDALTGTRYPSIIPDSGSNESEKTFIKDNSESVFDQVFLAGTSAGEQSGGDNRYVFAIYFDGATAGIPYLEAWDDNTHATAEDNFLGSGTPANSSIRAIATTNASPGSATWAGTPLAGTDSRIELDTAALSAGKNLYFNIKQLVTNGTHTPGSSTDLVLTLRYLYS
ncbi:hypothetical protein [Desulfobacula toluolica]|uniref:Uncharacterized protein n=1 Tax=Desulfobacula toluolica (strain DSM 7467 / Tol2) TaxID=651182 RepID=K0NQI0_DESTT|nr:hypothetical protein [Desulfobacula toluolica]CCK81187.1 uncharacterized protein TOL2_C30280 [Desulfobacula toluolica Tol2]